MRDPARIPRILEALRVEWEKQPDLRLGQLLMNVVTYQGANYTDKAGALFYCEDEHLVRLTRMFMAPEEATPPAVPIVDPYAATGCPECKGLGVHRPGCSVLKQQLEQTIWPSSGPKEKQ